MRRIQLLGCVSLVGSLAVAACGSSGTKTTDKGDAIGSGEAGSGGGGNGGGAGAGSGGAAGKDAGAAGVTGADAAAAGAGGGGPDAVAPDKAGDSSSGGDVGAGRGDAAVGAASMSFFVTSKGMGKGGNLGGLAGADAYCKTLATAVSAAMGAKNWKAYLSTSTVNANSRIGTGPWYNAKGVIIANSLQQLHGEQGVAGLLNATWPIGPAAFDVIVDETGGKHDQPVHDMLTGSKVDGTVDGDNHCMDWTSTTGMAANGHSNRDGGGRPPSWNAAHTVGCGPELDGGGNLINRVAGTVTSGGGRGSFYCFAAP